MRHLLIASTALALAIGAGTAVAQSGIEAEFIDTDGQSIGTATLTETPHGVLIEADITGLRPGEHAFHVHETGMCDAEGGFESAGGHYAPRGNEHGFQNENGPHAGDLPNQFVGEDGRLQVHAFAWGVTLSEGEASLLDEDGSALVVHAGADDYSTEPSGDAGNRLACAVIEQG
jgi:superoxide dismutase, Cu-Zn family